MPRSLRVLLGAVIALGVFSGDSRLGAQDANGAAFTAALQLVHAPFAFSGLPNTIAHRRAADSAEPIDVVVFLHGFNGCAVAISAESPVPCGSRARKVAPGFLLQSFDRAESQALLLVPQFALLARDGNPGRFADSGGFAAFLREAMDQPQLPTNAASRRGKVTLVAHSGGYQAALAILADPESADIVNDVVLLDALYGGEEAFADWLAADNARRLVTLHLGRGKTARKSRWLLAQARRRDVKAAELKADAHAKIPAQRGVQLWVVRGKSTVHGRLPRTHLAPLLRMLNRAR